MSQNLLPRQIVEELDKYIIGQADAKRAVAIALRNRYRRSLLPEEIRDEIVPKNILMIGPTGVGKTEIARRLARLINAPMAKVEATKFTEVGYVGRDVDSMVRDLVETAIRMVKAERMALVETEAEQLAEERLLDVLAPLSVKQKTDANPFELLFGLGDSSTSDQDDPDPSLPGLQAERDRVKVRLAQRTMEDHIVEIELEDSGTSMLEVFTGAGVEEMGINLQEVLGNVLPRRVKKKRVSVATGRRLLAQEEAQKLIDHDEVIAEGVRRAEQMGIIFIDEIDKITGRDSSGGPDVSREGVQRDILPIVEGSTVVTKYGPVRTDYVLFIAAGAFHVAKPTDLIPELQGRFPVRVELQSLTEEDFTRILTQPQNAIVKQYVFLLETEGIKLNFTDDAIDEIARIAASVNQQMENIGARRLHTILELLLEEISFAAGETTAQEISIDANYVIEQLEGIVKDQDLSQYVL